MPRYPQAPQVYETVNLFAENCLRSDGSLLWEGETGIWTLEHVSILVRNFVESPDFSDRPFWAKLEDQLRDLPTECFKVMADSFVVYALPSAFMRLESKWDLVRRVCEMGGLQVPALRSPLREALSQGFTRTSLRYHRKYMQLWLILLMARELKSLPQSAAVLEDPWAMAELLDNCLAQVDPVDRAYDMRHAILHMLFPEHFERIISTQDKERIITAYAQYLPTDVADRPVDWKIARIREALEDEWGQGSLDFYAPEVRRQWREDEGATVHEPGQDGEDDDDLPPADPLLEQLFQPLKETGQIILYGPPGTGKTYHALRLAQTLIAVNNFEKESVEALTEEERKYLRADFARGSSLAWWCVANPKRWSWESFRSQDTIDFVYGRIPVNFEEAQAGDLVFCYEATPTLAITALARVSEPLHEADGLRVITLQKVALLEQPIPFAEIRNDSILRESQAVRQSNRGTLFRVEPGEAVRLLRMIHQSNPETSIDLGPDPEPEVSYLRMCTFHPAYGYEEFVEGYRPYLTETGTPYFQIQDGIFKRLCRDARQHPDRTFVLIIDEINRGNIPRIFGELITLIERDKRWYPDRPDPVTVELPMSREPFTIPNNVYIIGTMNTADKSIALLDTALRRRFAFKELLPDAGLLRGVAPAGIPLDKLLERLNQRIVQVVGRNLQIGHAYFLDVEGKPVSTPSALAAVLRDKVLPLLQDYCYDDYEMLHTILGSGLVDVSRQRFHPEVMDPNNENVLLGRVAALVAGEES